MNTLDFTFGFDNMLRGEAKALDIPKCRIADATTALSIFKKLEPTQQERIKMFSIVKSQLDGDPPYNEDELKKLGLSYASNTNWRDMEAFIEEHLENYMSLIWNDVPFPIVFDARIGERRMWSEVNRILQEEMRDLLSSYFDYHRYLNLMLKDSITYGAGWIFWPDEDSFCFRPIDMWKIYVPPRTKNDPSLVNLAALDVSFTAQEFVEIYEGIEKINKSDKPDAMGWNKIAIGEVLLAQYGGQIKGRGDISTLTIMDIQNAIKANEIGYADRAMDEIRVIMLFVKEYSGKISKFIISPTQTLQDFLYKHEEQYECAHDALFMIPLLPGESEYHTNKGMGQRTSSNFEVQTRLDNALFDGAMRAATTYARTRTGRGRDARAPRWVHAGIIDVGEMEFVQSFMNANITPMAEVQGRFRQKLQQNNNYVNYDPSSAPGNYKTAGEIQAAVTRSAGIQKNRAEHFYNYMDVFTRVFVKKIIQASKKTGEGHKLAKQFVANCIERTQMPELFKMRGGYDSNALNYGLPPQLRVSAARAMSSGSRVADQQESAAIMQLAPNLPPTGRINAVKDRIRSIRGSRGGFVDRYMPDDELPQKSFPEDSIIALENYVMLKGGKAVVAEANDDGAHLDEHLREFVPYAQHVADNPQMLQEAAAVLDGTVGPHLMQHLSRFGQDPANRPKFEEYQSLINNLANSTKQIIANAKTQMDAQQREAARQQQQMEQAQQIGTSSDPKMVKVVREDARKRDEMTLKNQRENIQTALEDDRKDRKTQAEIERDRERAAQTPSK